MDSLMKKGDRVIINVEPSVKGNDVEYLIAEANRITESAGRTAVLQLGDFQNGAYEQSSIDVVLSFVSNDNSVHEILRILKPGGFLVLHEPINPAEKVSAGINLANRISQLRLSGFSLISSTSKTIPINSKLHGVFPELLNGICEIIAEKPAFEIGSSMPLNFVKPTANVWKIDAAMDDDIIDEDNLLSNEDSIRPEAASLRVCNTTGKRKACKDCSCGLARELNDTAVLQNTSSCGSCYLGDAFRCASCPYLGMPAFMPGEKVVLSDNQLSTGD